MSFFSELKRRNVFRVAAAYAVISWIVVQVVVAIETPLSLPNWVDTLVIVQVIIGFPVALFLTWALELTPDGVKKAEVIDADSVDTPSEKRALDYGLLVALILLTLVTTASFFYRPSAVVSPETAKELAPEIENQIKASIAVLPFADLSEESNKEYLSDGIAEEILNVLAKTRGLKVASRTSAFRFKGDAVDITEAAKQLKVAHVLEGSVRTQGNRIRITAQLIDANSGYHLWSETYDKSMNDIFALQDEISVNIVKALLGNLGVDALPENRFQGTRNLEAHDLYLRALHLGVGIPSPGPRMESVISHLKQAIALDEGFTDAWAALSLWQLRYEKLTEAIISASRAIALDPDNIKARLTLAAVIFAQGDSLNSEKIILQLLANEENTNDKVTMATVRLSYGIHLKHMGRFKESVAQLERSFALNPTHLNTHTWLMGIYVNLGRFAEARAFFERIEAEKGFAETRGKDAYFIALAADGMLEEARALLQRDGIGPSTRMAMEYHLARLDGKPDAAKQLEAGALRLIEEGRVSLMSTENLVIAGNIEAARQYAPRYDTRFSYEMTAYLSDEIDPRYLDFYPNLLPLLDVLPIIKNRFLKSGRDLEAEGRAKGLL